ncbi:putative exporter of the RND superfamily [Halapricum desulfuricans]|uniref:Putative exporter of the RND superfamily n=1 Tax=Halapricum desulfuricans TaxID=2841257 RepID=A0A897NJI5_9EURY|nr:hypothetical protein [Halapricum desulfuricans]QSG12604.1 putative exporter of the RND superfamily [Halapricum desulfuricans]
MATGATVTTAVIQDALLETLIEAVAVTLVVILLFLTALFRVRYGSWSLGPVAVLPVVVALAWLLGAMSLLGVSFNSETTVITSLAIVFAFVAVVTMLPGLLVVRERLGA